MFERADKEDEKEDKQMGGDGGNDKPEAGGGDALMSVFFVADTSCSVLLQLAALRLPPKLRRRLLSGLSTSCLPVSVRTRKRA